MKIVQVWPPIYKPRYVTCFDQVGGVCYWRHSINCWWWWMDGWMDGWMVWSLLPLLGTDSIGSCSSWLISIASWDCCPSCTIEMWWYVPLESILRKYHLIFMTDLFSPVPLVYSYIRPYASSPLPRKPTTRDHRCWCSSRHLYLGSIIIIIIIIQLSHPIHWSHYMSSCERDWKPRTAISSRCWLARSH